MTTHTEQNIANVKRARTTKIARCRELISTRIGRKDPRGISELADLRTELAELLSRPIAA